MNNLEDISMNKRYGDIVGYTQQELEYFLSDRLNITADNMKITRDELLTRMKNYYDVFCFDGNIMYLKLIYRVEGYALLGNQIWKALRQGDIPEIVRRYNIAIANIPYDDFPKNRNEFWYNSMFIMLLRGAGIISYSEPHTSKGRADVVIHFNNFTVVLEFKFAENSSDVENMKRKGLEQMQARNYVKGYDDEGLKIISAVLVADNEKRKVVV